MEGLRGKQSYEIDRASCGLLVACHEDVLVDIGTGDGRSVRHLAATRPSWLAVGVDAWRENLWEASRKAPPNALFVIANALALPREMHGIAGWITVNFPWGSLLEGLHRRPVAAGRSSGSHPSRRGIRHSPQCRGDGGSRVGAR
jgi:hypothetical protein